MFRKFFIAVTILLLFPMVASADLGPKPTMDFVFTNIPGGVKILDGQQLLCDDIFCLIAHPLESLGPQGFGCGDNYCRSLAYGYDDYGKLAIVFSDKKRESNVFRKGPGLESAYEVKIDADDGLLVTEMNSSGVGSMQASTQNKFPLGEFSAAFIITILLELMVGFVYVSARKLPWTILAGVLAANAITVQIFWILDFSYNFSATPYLIAEIIIVLFESVALKLSGRGSINWKNSILLSFFMNLTSFVIGNVVLLVQQ